MSQTTTQNFETSPELLAGPHFELIQGGGKTSPHTGQLELAVDSSLESSSYPDVIKVSELTGDAELVAEAQRNIKMKLVGDFAVAETVEVMKKPIKNLRESIIWAGRGDTEGIAMIDENIGTEMVEQAYKAGNVATTRLKVDNEDIYQHGQRMSDVQRNAYQLASDDPIIKPRTEAEANNAARMKRLHDTGLLEDNVFVRFSMCAEGVSDEKLDELRFFSSTKSISVQMDYSERGELVEEVAMVAGVKEKDAERHDRGMIEGIAKHFGHSYEGMSDTEIIDNGLLIPKKYVKDGVVDIVRIMDDINGGTFYGQDVLRQDYIEHKKFCEERAVRFSEDIIAVREQLIAEKDSFISAGPINAIKASRRMAKLVSEKIADKAFIDNSIDPMVLGQECAVNLVQARVLAAEGRHHEAQMFLQVARAAANGGSCPGAFLEMFGNNDPGKNNNESKEEDVLYCVSCPSCGTEHDVVRKSNDGKYHCKNEECKLH